MQISFIVFTSNFFHQEFTTDFLGLCYNYSRVLCEYHPDFLEKMEDQSDAYRFSCPLYLPCNCSFKVSTIAALMGSMSCRIQRKPVCPFILLPVRPPIHPSVCPSSHPSRALAIAWLVGISLRMKRGTHRQMER